MQIARHLQISQRLIHKVINKFRNVLIAARATPKEQDDSECTPSVHHLPIPAPLASAYRLSALEICTLRRKMLGTKPAQVSRAFRQCCMTFKYKIHAHGLLDGLSACGLWWQRIKHRVKKISRLIVFEHEETRMQRIRFIRVMQKYRTDAKRIIYINELNPLTSDDSMANALIIAAASADGPIASVYMKKLTTRNFLKWITNQIFAKLTESVVIVLRSSSIFRTHRICPMPEQNDSREQMVAWLQAHNVDYDEDMYKTELFDRILLNDEAHAKYTIDVKIRERGHDIVYIPYNNADLDPFELIWSHMKLKMMAHGVRSFNMNKEFMNIESDVWKEHFKRIIEVESTYIGIERNFDRTIALYRVEKDACVESDDDDDCQEY